MPDKTPRGSLLVRVFRWKPQNEPQVWLVAAAIGVMTILIWTAFHNPAGAVAAGSGVAIVTGIGERLRLHKRQDAEVAAEWAERRTKPRRQ